jgi:catechol 2,3-dioxygenase-like lactoylglutathione lyase family enzyme
MVGYTTVGTNDWDAATAFYDELLGTVGAKRLFEMENFVLWGTAMDKGCLALVRPYDKKPATVGNGVMVAFQMETPEAVDAFYAKALALGATDEGPPGKRMEGFYAGYFRDLDGNKLNAFKLG